MSVQNIVNINESNLQQTLEQSMTTPVLFYFWSERSQHCLQLTPVLESLAAQYNGQFILAKLDCDAEQMIASQFGLRAIPTVYLFQNGQPVDGFQGPQPEEAIRALLDKVLPREEELKAQQAMQLMQEGNYIEALPLLKDAWQLSHQNGEIGLLLHYQNGWLSGEVSDDGPGIDPERLEAIFTKGYSTKGENRGVGLFLARQQIQNLGGDITVESEPGVFTQFFVQIPWDSERNIA